MNKLFTYISRRAKQGLTVGSFGPNEARIAFDLVSSIGSALATQFYASVVLHGVLAVDYRLGVVAIAFPAVNAAVGIYSRFRRSRIRIKVAALLISVLLVCLIGVAIGVDVAALV